MAANAISEYQVVIKELIKTLEGIQQLHKLGPFEVIRKAEQLVK